MRRHLLIATLFALLSTVPLHADSVYQLTLTGGGNTVVFTQPATWSFPAGPALVQVPGQSGSGTYNGVPTFISDTFYIPFLASGRSVTIAGIELWGEQVIQLLTQVLSPLGNPYLDTVGIAPGTYLLETDPNLNPFLNPPPVLYTLVIGSVSTAATPEPASLFLVATALLAGVIGSQTRTRCPRT